MDKKEVSSPFSPEQSIDALNDDCLLNIFYYLPIRDRIRIERVCKRWKKISKESWRNLKFISIGNDLSTRSIEINHFEEILRRSGNYMTNFDCSWLDQCQLPVHDTVQLINKYCKKLTHLNTCYTFKTDENYLNAFHVNLLKNLKSLNIGNTVCLDETLSEMLEKAVNLEEFNLTGYARKTRENPLLSLSDKCKTLAITYSQALKDWMLQEVLQTHSNIQNLDVSGQRIAPFILLPFTNQLTCLALWEMEKFFEYDVGAYMGLKFPNLRVLDIRFNENGLTGEILTVFIENCPNIEDLRLERSWKLKDEHFEPLKKLKKLMYLDVSFTHISNNSLITLSETSGKLKKLECYGSSLVDATGLSKVISSSPELTYLSISTKSLSKQLIDSALESLEDRKNKVPLTVCLSSKNVNDIVKKLPYLIKNLKLQEDGIYNCSKNNFLRVVFGTSKCYCNFDKTCFCLDNLKTLAFFG